MPPLREAPMACAHSCNSRIFWNTILCSICMDFICAFCISSVPRSIRPSKSSGHRIPQPSSALLSVTCRYPLFSGIVRTIVLVGLFDILFNIKSFLSNLFCFAFHPCGCIDYIDVERFKRLPHSFLVFGPTEHDTVIRVCYHCKIVVFDKLSSVIRVGCIK